MFLLSELTEEQAKLICGWKYEEEYRVCNYPDWETILSQKWGITDEARRKAEFTAVIDQANSLFAYFRFAVTGDIVMLGLGMNPQFCGKGNGAALMKCIIDEFQKRYFDKTLELEVRDFNKRAIQCYIRAGFQVIDRYCKDTPIGMGSFLRMRYGV